MKKKELICIPPPSGWKEHTVYIVTVSHNKQNPEHKAILHTGFINKDGSFGGYCEVWQNGYERAYQTHELHSIKFVKELCQFKE